MPVKDLVGKPRPTEQERAMLADIHRRLGLPPPGRRGGSADGGTAPVPPAPCPGSGPLAGAAAIG